MGVTNGIFVEILRCSDFSWVYKVVIQSIPACFVFGIAEPLTSTTSEKYVFKNIHNVIDKALVPRENILLPSLHIKLGLLKQFVKGLDSNSAAVRHKKKKFHHLSDAKVKGGIFTGLQIHVMFAPGDVEQTMTVERNT
jgi:hypothetical protein